MLQTNRAGYHWVRQRYAAIILLYWDILKSPRAVKYWVCKILILSISCKVELYSKRSPIIPAPYKTERPSVKL